MNFVENYGTAVVDNSSDSTPLSDSLSSILPPRAVDLLLQEEAKQQRLLLKLREKAQVEKTLAELELLQMQKRILRAQGESEKAASIKKRQRGLLLKLQEERARIEVLRRQHKKEEKKSQAISEHHYESSWETDWSAASTSVSVAAVAAAAAAVDNSLSNCEVVDQEDQSNNSSTSALHPVNDKIPVSVNVDDRLDVHGDIMGSTTTIGTDEINAVDLGESKSEGIECTTAVSGVRLRAQLSPRTSSSDSIRARMKFRHRHSSGSDDSINLSQNGKLNSSIFCDFHLAIIKGIIFPFYCCVDLLFILSNFALLKLFFTQKRLRM